MGRLGTASPAHRTESLSPRDLRGVLERSSQQAGTTMGPRATGAWAPTARPLGGFQCLSVALAPTGQTMASARGHPSSRPAFAVRLPAVLWGARPGRGLLVVGVYCSGRSRQPSVSGVFIFWRRDGGASGWLSWDRQWRDSGRTPRSAAACFRSRNRPEAVLQCSLALIGTGIDPGAKSPAYLMLSRGIP